MVTPLKTFALRPPKAPDLPIAPVQYTQQYQDQVLNALRLYFNQLDNFAQPFTGEYGGGYLKFPNIAALYTAEQYATNNNVPTLVKWDTQESDNGFILNLNNTVTAQFPGVYKITYSYNLQIRTMLIMMRLFGFV